jgi:hypothetical protein
MALGAAVVAGLLTAAHADASVSANCSVSGMLHTQPPVQLLQGATGTYSLDNYVFACQGAVDGAQDVFTNNFGTSGTYASHSCTSLTLDSTSAAATIANSIAGNEGKPFSFTYHANVSGGFGSVWLDSPGKGIGSIAMVPTGPQAFPACTSTYALTAEFSLVLP